MDVRRTDGILISGLVMAGTGVILQSISQATTYWMYYDRYQSNGLQYKLHYGLFKGCGKDICLTYSPLPEELEKTQGLTLAGLTLAVLVCALLTIVTIQGCRCQLKSPMLGAFAGILALVSGLLTFSGAMVFVVQVYSSVFLGWELYLTMELGYSFVLSIVGAIVTGMGGIFAWIGTSRLAAFANRTPGQVISSGPSNMAVVYSVGNAPGECHINLSQPNQSLGMQPYAGPMYAIPPLNSGPAMSFPSAPGNPPQPYGFNGYAPSPPPYSDAAIQKNEN